MKDVVIIGCGIAGASVAYELSRYNLDVCVVEKENDVSNQTTKANSAIVHAGYDPEPGTDMARLNVLGNKMIKDISKQLDVPYKQCGSLVIAFDDEDKKTLKILYERGKRNGVEGLKLLDGKETKKLEPNLSGEVVGSLFAPTAGIVSPWELALALAETAVLNGVCLNLNSEVVGIEKIGGGYKLQIEGKEDIKTKCVINAAGVFSDQIHDFVSSKRDFEIYPDRGEYYLLDKSEGQRVNRIIFQCPTKLGKGTLIAPTVHGNLIVGPNNEQPKDKEDVATTSEGLAQIARLAKKSVPSVDLRESIRNFSGIRANSNQKDFVIEEVNDAPGFIDLAGIKSPGLTAALAIAKDVLGLLGKSGLKFEPKPNFINERKRIKFKELSDEEKKKLIEKNPAYGRVICRCETVTEGEILDCLKGPIPPVSVDGVKRRCNPGMGRCQGGFCGPTIVGILSKELGCSKTQILQDKKGTEILTSKTKEGTNNV